MDSRGRKRKIDECADICDNSNPKEILGTSDNTKVLEVSKRRRTKEYSEYLFVGDVIFTWRFPGYKHYGIVSEVTSNSVLVIHYSTFGAKFTAMIRQDPIEIFAGTNGVVHSLNFSSRITQMMYGKPLLATEVVARARKKLGKKGGKYRLLTNNCEHFAIKCKTGREICWQSFKYKIMGGLVLASSLVYYAPIVASLFLFV